MKGFLLIIIMCCTLSAGAQYADTLQYSPGYYLKTAKRQAYQSKILQYSGVALIGISPVLIITDKSSGPFSQPTYDYRYTQLAILSGCLLNICAIIPDFLAWQNIGKAGDALENHASINMGFQQHGAGFCYTF